FFFSSRRRHTRLQGDWSSDVCSSDLRLAEIEARNQCDTRVYQVEKLLRENREKLPEADAKLVEEALEQCRRALADGSIDRIKSATEALEKTTHKVAEVLYRTGAAAAQGGPGGPTPPGTGTPGSGGEQKSGEVIDAEYVDVDESKRPN